MSHSFLLDVRISVTQGNVEISNLVLVYHASLEQMHVELMYGHMEVHGGAGGSYEFCTKYCMTLRHDV